MALGDTFAVAAENGGKMCKFRHRNTQCFVDCNLPSSVRDMIIAADNVCDLHLGIVDHDHVVVDRHSGGADDDQITDHFIRKFDLTADNVMKADGMIRNFQPYCCRLSGYSTTLRFSRIDLTTLP